MGPDGYIPFSNVSAKSGEDHTGDVAGWLMQGLTRVSPGVLAGGVPLDWQIAGVGDLDGNGTADLVWRNTSTGDVAGRMKKSWRA